MEYQFASSVDEAIESLDNRVLLGGGGIRGTFAIRWRPNGEPIHICVLSTFGEVLGYLRIIRASIAGWPNQFWGTY